MELCIIGLGYVGLPLAIACAEKNDGVVYGLDIDQDKVNKLEAGISYFKDIKDSTIKSIVENGKLKATTDVSIIALVKAIIICVPTPLGKHNEPDTSYISKTIEMIIPFIQKGTLVVLESTTYPGCTEELVQRKIEENLEYICGEDFYVGYSPEREDPGNSKSNVKLVPKVISGATDNCLKKVKELYSSIGCKTVEVQSLRTAEAVKLTENIFRCVNIALVNELKVVFEKMNIDIFEVVDAAKTKPYGYMPFYPGPGLGGHCIPIDPFYLNWKAKEYSINTKFIELAGEVNNSMTGWVTSILVDELNKRKKSLNGSKILIMGIAYKPNIDDDRESPAYPIMENLIEQGAKVSYHDPLIEKIPDTRKYSKLKGEMSKKFDNSYDAYLIITNHQVFENYMFDNIDGAIIDTRGMLRGKAINARLA